MWYCKKLALQALKLKKKKKKRKNECDYVTQGESTFLALVRGEVKLKFLRNFEQTIAVRAKKI